MQYSKKTGYIFVKTNPGYTKEVYDHFTKADFVIGAWVVTGDYDIIAWVNAHNEDDLYKYATTIRGWNGVEYTNSHYVHEGYVEDVNALRNTNGTWVRLRADNMQDFPNYLREYPYVKAWASMPGEYDYLVYTTGNTMHEAMENVLKMTHHRNWRTYTHVPLYAHWNTNWNANL